MKYLSLGLFVCSSFFIQIHDAHAHDPAKRMCIRESINEFNLCKSTCRETFHGDKATCGVNPECHHSCKDALKACVKPIEDQLKACFDTCSPALDDAKKACETSANCKFDCKHNPLFLSCLRTARLDKYTCVRDCKDAWLTNAEQQNALKACKETGEACHKSCNQPAATPTPGT